MTRDAYPGLVMLLFLIVLSLFACYLCASWDADDLSELRAESLNVSVEKLSSFAANALNSERLDGLSLLLNERGLNLNGRHRGIPFVFSALNCAGCFDFLDLLLSMGMELDIIYASTTPLIEAVKRSDLELVII